MRTLGIDLAAGPRTTAAAVVVWEGSTAVVEPPRLRCTDEDLLGLLGGLQPGDRAGVDCPFGWPIPFVEAVSAHAAGRPWPGRGTDSTTHRATLRLRRTDLLTHRALGAGARPPLSVSFDRLGATTARWAHLADALAARGLGVERTGAGSVVEVYPAAARLRWGLGSPRSMEVLLGAAPQLRCDPGVRELYDRSEHAFDALIAALVARAVALGLTALPEGEDRAAAEIEGWIHLPTEGSLPRLFRRSVGGL
ncbi:DUF429 domain-containing protein [Streptomyces sp. PSKA54]|uniref:DUF429 domain-containing protein n=1 Tax=Streptomyces himalayensis subsp. aureolus TaxID=2758039 RepID=A0A7W2D2F0_9ACTN|nr:DUF429 domain-containing protein [Streptomyces himalayensis]MBA4863349.1 DUF429 domain-containing protein [Streptomyces himalayensis subsp. aureolus]